MYPRFFIIYLSNCLQQNNLAYLLVMCSTGTCNSSANMHFVGDDHALTKKTVSTKNRISRRRDHPSGLTGDLSSQLPTFTFY